MAKPEQTEKPTAKRINEARKKGQVPKSPDLPAAVLFLFAVYTLHSSMIGTLDSTINSVHGLIDHLYQQHGLNYSSFTALFVQAGWVLLPLTGTLFLASLIIAIGVNLAQFGFLFTFAAISPKFAKLNPIQGVKSKFFSLGVLVNLGKQVAKISAVMVICYWALSGNVDAMYNVSRAAPHDILVFINDLTYSIGWKFGWLLLILSLVDYAYERHKWYDSLKMTKQEVKDEWKQMEGNQEAKQATKKRQREAARRRMMAAVPKATVVVTNPTHFAIALAWDDLKMDAPVLTAKGADLLAKRIREIAKEHNVPIVENPPLARTLYERVDLDTAIPHTLYAAVAQLIAFVYKLKNRTIA